MFLNALKAAVLGATFVLATGCGQSDPQSTTLPAETVVKQPRSRLEVARLRYIEVVLRDRNAHRFSYGEKVEACDRYLAEIKKAARSKDDVVVDQTTYNQEVALVEKNRMESTLAREAEKRKTASTTHTPHHESTQETH